MVACMGVVGEFLVLLTFYSCDRTKVEMEYVISTIYWYILVKSKLTAISSRSPITDENALISTGFRIVSQSNANRLLQTAAIVTCLLDAGLGRKVSQSQMPSLNYESQVLGRKHLELIDERRNNHLTL